MFRFANIEMLWWLITIPVFVIAYIIYTKRKSRQLAEFGDPELMAQLMPDASKSRPVWKFSLMIVAAVLLIIAAARPQFGQQEKTVKRQGIEVMVALDISNSMLAEDVAPNRLDRAKQMLSKMIDNMVDDKVGLVVFAGDAFTQLPITCDYVSAKMFLNTITPNLIQTQGTAIGTALQTAITSFGAQESDAGRAIILITDGENHEDDAVEVARRAAELGVRIYTIGIGTPEGAPITIGGDFIRDEKGEMVVSKLNEEMLAELANLTDGLYVRSTEQSIGLDEIVQEIEAMEKQELSTIRFEEFDEQYPLPLTIGLVLLLIELLLLDRRNPLLAHLNIFREER